MGESGYLSQWIDAARQDMRAAKSLRQGPEPSEVGASICFHFQQAAEKYLKAYLVSHDVNFRKVHNLEYLVKLCGTIDSSFEGLEAGNLTWYAVEMRYPDGYHVPSSEEVDDCAKTAERISAFVVGKLGITGDLA